MNNDKFNHHILHFLIMIFQEFQIIRQPTKWD